MSLIVEDGTGMPNSESYISTADATQYFSDRGNTAWAALTVTQQEQFLRLATDYMIEEYRDRWAGYRVKTTQALDWPRYYVPIRDAGGYGAYIPFYDPNSVPVNVARACAEFALRASTGELAPDLQRATISEKVGPIQVNYHPGSRQSVKYRALDNLLDPFLVGGGTVTMVTRA